VLFSEIIALTVLLNIVSFVLESHIERKATDTIVPAKTPAQHLKSIICQILLLNPKIAVEIATPINEKTSTGFLPILSAARPHEIINDIWVNENNDSYLIRQIEQKLYGTRAIEGRGPYNETRIKPHISHIQISCLLYHFIDEREDSKKGNGLNHSCKAEKKYLLFRKGLVADILMSRVSMRIIARGFSDNEPLIDGFEWIVSGGS